MTDYIKMEDQWYYRIELRKNEYTNGRRIGTFSLLKEIFERVDFVGKRVLDIGSQDFAAPILMQYHGASEIHAYDRLDLSHRMEQLKECYDLSRVLYLRGLPLLELKKKIESRGQSPAYDIVNFTGVLYHMIDPLAGLAIARSFLRQNGLMIMETSTSTDPGYVAQCNHHGSLYPGSNYFQVSVPTLDYWCRALHMEVVDAYWKGCKKGIKRTFLILRAIDHVLADDDEWIRKGYWEADFMAYGLDYKALASSATPVDYVKSLQESRTYPYVNGSKPYLDTYRFLSENEDTVPISEHGLRAKYHQEQLTKAGSLNLSDVGL